MSPKRYLHALLRPDTGFGDWTPAARVALVVVLGLCALNAVSFAHAGDAVVGAVNGSVAVDNPNRPPAWVCNDPSIPTHGDCNASKTIQQPLRPEAQDAVNAASFEAFFAPLAWSVLAAALLMLVSGRAGGRDGAAWSAFSRVYGVVGIAAAPFALRYLVRPLAVERALADWTHPQSLDGVRVAASNALFPEGTLWVAVSLLTGAWTVAVLYFGARETLADAPPRWAGAVALLAGFGAVGTTLLSVDGWAATAPAGPALLLVIVGLAGTLGTYTLIQIQKTLELIGFSGARRVQPRPWYVGLTRLCCVAIAAAGFVAYGGLALT